MKIDSLADLTPDPKNARKHTERNLHAIVESLHKVGAARSIVIDEDGRILAGNATVEAAGEAGIERVRVVDADGEEIIAVRRSGLTEEQKVQLAVADNRAAEHAAWDAPVLAELAGEVDLGAFFFEEELAALLSATESPDFREFDGESFDGIEDEITELKFKVPLGDVPIIEGMIDRIMEVKGIKDKGRALKAAAFIVQALDDGQL